ncbi:MAG: ATP-binding protein [Planctomycetia bacterium]|nr:ATP-binding protein [Planctomycetia bacterium]
MQPIEIRVNPGREVAEISHDFARPVEVVREALHNSYDAGAESVEVRAFTQMLPDGRRALSLEIHDDGIGMTDVSISSFFGLGFSEKPPIHGRRKIGYKGHGTKIFYQAKELYLATRAPGGPLLFARVTEAREAVVNNRAPSVEFCRDDEALVELKRLNLREPTPKGTTLRLVDYTPDSGRLISDFKTYPLENYIRWFTVHGSFEHVVRSTAANAPFRLRLTGTDEVTKDVTFGHPWPESDRLAMDQLRRLDDRRPFNYFCKSFRYPQRVIDGGYKIDLAVLFEGRRNRLERDPGIRRQRSGGLYAEEERYGVWLCKDFVPVELKPEWLLDEDCPKLFADLRNPLVLVNCQDFKLIANRGSVGNSAPQLLEAVKKDVFQVLGEVQDDRHVTRFLTEYQEDLFSRIREKDKKALQRRVERYNDKRRMTVKLSHGKKHEFWEPQREITLFGLIAELQVLDRSVLGFEILDYDDHHGIDLLVRRNGTGQVLDRQKVAYVELKFELGPQVNHAFDHLFGIVCWEKSVNPNDPVLDATGAQCSYQETKGTDGLTHSHLVPPPNGALTHNVRVVVLKRLLEEKYALNSHSNPRPIKR